MCGPTARGLGLRDLGAGVFQPEHAGGFASAVGGQHVQVAIAVDVIFDERHNPARIIPAMEAPRLRVARIFGRLQPADGSAVALGTEHEVDAAAINLQWQREHPQLFAHRGRNGFRAPRQ